MHGPHLILLDSNESLITVASIRIANIALCANYFQSEDVGKRSLCKLLIVAVFRHVICKPP